MVLTNLKSLFILNLRFTLHLYFVFIKIIKFLYSQVLVKTYFKLSLSEIWPYRNISPIYNVLTELISPNNIMCLHKKLMPLCGVCIVILVDIKEHNV
jgi:hypothetical protein